MSRDPLPRHPWAAPLTIAACVAATAAWALIIRGVL